MKSVMLKNVLEDVKLTAVDFQKDIATACATETINDIGDALFAILIVESFDILEDQMVVLRYVNKWGCVVERFLGIMHVNEITDVSLKGAIDALFFKHGLNIKNLRGQGYFASNIQDEFNGLKALIIKENEYAFYIHCFAHDLQLILVAAATKLSKIALFFHLVSKLLNIVGALCKSKDIFQDKQVTKVIEALTSHELLDGQGWKEENTLTWSGNKRCLSQYDALVILIVMFSSVLDLLEIITKDDSNFEQKGEAYSLLDWMQTFDFAFSLHLMKNILGITNELSKALQRKEHDVANAMALVKISKQRLHGMRDNGWDSLINEVALFCSKHDIIVPNMDDRFVRQGYSRRRVEEITNLHHYHIELFYYVIDMQLQELDLRFTNVNTELLLCMTCLSPSDSFSAFDKQKLVHLAQLYPLEFSSLDLMTLDNQLETYIIDVRTNNEFLELREISSLAKKMVETKKNILYPLVYLLVTLALILPVASATVERAYSVMHIVENRLQDRMRDVRMNDCLITYIENDIF